MYFNFKGKRKVYLETADQLARSSCLCKTCPVPLTGRPLNSNRGPGPEKANAAAQAVPVFCQPAVSHSMTNRGILLFII